MVEVQQMGETDQVEVVEVKGGHLQEYDYTETYLVLYYILILGKVGVVEVHLVQVPWVEMDKKARKTGPWSGGLGLGLCKPSLSISLRPCSPPPPPRSPATPAIPAGGTWASCTAPPPPPPPVHVQVGRPPLRRPPPAHGGGGGAAQPQAAPEVAHQL